MITSDRLILRAPEPEDIDFLFDLENDRQYWHLSNTRVPLSRFDLEQYIMTADKDIYLTRQVRFIIEKIGIEETKLIGAIDLFDFEPKHLRAGIGIMVIDEERKQGYAGEAIDLLIGYSRATLGLHQLYCNIEKDNEVSIKLFRSRGFEEAGVKKEWNKRNDHWVDEFLFQLLM